MQIYLPLPLILLSTCGMDFYFIFHFNLVHKVLGGKSCVWCGTVQYVGLSSSLTQWKKKFE